MVLISAGNWHLHPPKLIFNLFQVSLYFLLLVPPATSLSFSFTSFNNSVWKSIILPRGDAQLSHHSNIIDLTQNLTNSTGGVFYNDQVQIWDKKTGILTNFTTHFSFTFINSSETCNHGDGLTFFLAPNGYVIHDHFAGAGYGLFNSTLGNSTLANNPNIVAVEFDTYQNAWDPDSNHIGIDIYSIISVTNISCNRSLWNWMRNNSSPWEASVGYDSSSFNLIVVLTCADKSVSCETCSLNYNVDLRKYLPEEVTVGFSSSKGYSTELHQLNSWDFSSSLKIDKPPNMGSPAIDNSKNMGMVVGLVLGGATMITILGLFWFFWWRRKNQKSKADDDMVLDVPMGPREFSYAELARATNNFDEKQKLGEGGFGGVYRGFLNDLKMDVAVKRISQGSKQGKKEYASEVKVISRLRHRNLVQLVGWCHQRKEQLLVYEFLPNGSLDFHLFRNRGSLTWELRYKIALDLASALQYLHEGWEQCIVHRDIKSSNIILDSNFHAKLGDFGLARLVEHEKGSQTSNVVGTMRWPMEHENISITTNVTGTMGWPMEHENTSKTTNVAGTTGYMAPEYVITGMASKETDVYSFGIVLLEIACGRKPVDEMMADPSEVSLVTWVWELYGRGKHLEVADPSQGMDYDKQQIECMIIVGLWCAQQDFHLRPSIGKAINVLKFEAPLPILPYSRVHVSPPFVITSSQVSAEYDTISLTKYSSRSCFNIDSAKLDRSFASASSAASSLLHNTR